MRPLLTYRQPGWKAQPDRPLRVSPRSPAHRSSPGEAPPPRRSSTQPAASRRLSVPALPLERTTSSIVSRVETPKRRHMTVTFGSVTRASIGRVQAMAKKFEAGEVTAFGVSPIPEFLTPLQPSQRPNRMEMTAGMSSSKSRRRTLLKVEERREGKIRTPEGMPKLRAPLLTPTPGRLVTPRGKMMASVTKTPMTGPLKAVAPERRGTHGGKD